jgi:hypothetical protein
MVSLQKWPHLGHWSVISLTSRPKKAGPTAQWCSLYQARGKVRQTFPAGSDWPLQTKGWILDLGRIICELVYIYIHNSSNKKTIIITMIMTLIMWICVYIYIIGIITPTHINSIITWSTSLLKHGLLWWAECLWRHVRSSRSPMSLSRSPSDFNQLSDFMHLKVPQCMGWIDADGFVWETWCAGISAYVDQN